MPHRQNPLFSGARLLLTVATAALMACASTPALPPGWPGTLQTLLPADVLLLGEQHDAPEHQAMQRAAVQWLAERGVLASVVLEMAPAGGSTAQLPPHASEDQVRTALQWNERLWPWATYAGAAMAAVRAGIPVLGGNLPRDAMRAAMANSALDAALPASAYAAQLQAVREGHCDLLPESQLPGMVRIQIARDQRMAQVALAAAARAPGKTVLLIAGNGHVLRSRGIPVFLPPKIESKVVLALTSQALTAIKNEANRVEFTAALPQRDVCAPLRTPLRAPLRTPS